MTYKICETLCILPKTVYNLAQGPVKVKRKHLPNPHKLGIIHLFILYISEDSMANMEMEELLAVARLFELDSRPLSCVPHGEGHINRTYCVTTEKGTRYIMQKINDHVFPDVKGLMENIEGVTEYLRRTEKDPRRVQTIVRTLEGDTYLRLESGYWRVYVFVEDSVCLQQPEDGRDFYMSAVAFGSFQNQLKDYPAETLHETIPNFHNTVIRYRNFKETLAKDPVGRAAKAQPEIAFALAREADAAVLVDRLAAGILPLKVTHNDTKLNNVMLDEKTHEPLCVIDLDTVMPGLPAYDYGDSIRFGANTAAEDEEDLDKVRFDLDRFRAYTRGFLEACPTLTQAERESLCWGAKLMTLECGVRFLTDYIDGDHYFGVHKPDHNLLRCRTQFKLVAEMEKCWDQMEEIVRSAGAAAASADDASAAASSAAGVYSNAKIFMPDGSYLEGGFEVTADGRFGAVGPEITVGRDLGGAKVLPGLVETHCHGALGSDFADGDYEGLVAMARFLASKGITSFAPASVTVSYEKLDKAFRTGARVHREQPEGGAYLCGINMEGPFFSRKKCGAQNPEFLKEPDAAAFARLQEAAEGLIRLADVAPELPGALDFIREVSRTVTVSLAHSAANYDEAKAGFEAGATHVTHLFNAMSGLGHREPGMVGAAAERDDVTAELICDGHHVHPAAVRAAFKLFPGRICLISDALCCLGMPEGEYELGGQKVFMKEGLARLADGTIAGAATDLWQDMRNAVRFGIPEGEAILAATLNPAKSLGLDGELGSIEPGKRADFVVVDGELRPEEIYLKGKKLA